MIGRSKSTHHPFQLRAHCPQSERHGGVLPTARLATSGGPLDPLSVLSEHILAIHTCGEPVSLQHPSPSLVLPVHVLSLARCSCLNSWIPAQTIFSTNQNLLGPLQNGKNWVARKHGAPNAGSSTRQSVLTRYPFTGYALNTSLILLIHVRHKNFSRASKISNFEPAKSNKKIIKW